MGEQFLAAASDLPRPEASNDVAASVSVQPQEAENDVAQGGDADADAPAENDGELALSVV